MEIIPDFYLNRPKNHFNQVSGQKIPSPNNPHLPSLIGALVGNFDGALVGAFVGVLVGAFVGALVGAFDGTFVGAFEGGSFAVRTYFADKQSFSKPNSNV